MHGPTYILFVFAVSSAYCAYDLRHTLKTGRARLWPGGVATRAGRPDRFWRYVYGSWGFLVFSAAVMIALLIRPELFGR